MTSSGEFEETESFKSSGDQEDLYDYTFGIELPQNEGVVVLQTPLNLAAIEYGQLPLFRNTIGEVELMALLQAYLSVEVATSVTTSPPPRAYPRV